MVPNARKNIRERIPEGHPLNEDHYWKHSRDAVHKILGALSPKMLLSEKLPIDPHTLGLTPPFFLLSIGKAASEMTETIANQWNIPPEMTLTLIPKGSTPPKNYPVLYGEHPFPGASSTRSTKKILTKISSLSSKTTLISAISGGTSSLLSAPIHQITLEEKVQVITSLMKKGLAIDQINLVRTALSRVKGGKLLNFFHGSEVLTILLSDTPGMPPGTVGSGPTIPCYLTEGTRENPAIWILKNILSQDDIPHGALKSLRKKTSPPARHLLVHDPLIIGNTQTVLQKSISLLETPNTTICIWSDELKGESQTVGSVLGSLILHDRRISPKDQLFIGAGETTVPLGNTKGKGGRTLEVGLSLAQTLYDGGFRSFIVGALATDGVDGNSGLAGCIIPGQQFGKSQRDKIRKSLWDHNTKSVIIKNEWAIRTGPTGTNLNDLFWVFIPKNK